ncbi:MULTISPECIES: hypothetical protein [unclassified Streptomyces]|uniref:hypothetical protein n=1 Tax=unclassified Streptomyces TaxID=2593676 RepID=UPI0033E365F1
MQDSHRDSSRPHTPAQSAADEVLQEVEEAEERPVPDEERERAKDGEAGDTLTPSPGAQEDIHHDDGDSGSR